MDENKLYLNFNLALGKLSHYVGTVGVIDGRYLAAVCNDSEVEAIANELEYLLVRDAQEVSMNFPDFPEENW